jgi:hypothetical protein
MEPAGERRRRGTDVATHRRRATLLALAGAIVVAASVIPSVVSWARDEPEAAEPGPPADLPDAVTTYDVGGDERPEFVSIRGEVFAVPPDTSEPWWVTALNPGSTLGAALIAAGSVWYQTTKGRADMERRLTELEGRAGDATGDGSA